MGVNMTTIFDKGEPLEKYAKRKFFGKIYDSASVHNLGVNLTQDKRDWEQVGYSVKILQLKKPRVQIIYIRDNEIDDFEKARKKLKV
jgi:hypothetical protein